MANSKRDQYLRWADLVLGIYFAILGLWFLWILADALSAL